MSLTLCYRRAAHCAAALLPAVCLAVGQGSEAPSGILARGRVWAVSLPAPPAGSPEPAGPPNATSSVLVTAGNGRILRVAPDGRIAPLCTLSLPSETAALPASIGNPPRSGLVAVDTRSSVHAFDATGGLVWRRELSSRAGGNRRIVVADTDGDGAAEVLTSDSRGYLRVHGADGRLRLEAKLGSYRVSPCAVGDINGDGTAEIVAGTDEGDVFCLDRRSVLWVARPGGRFGRSLPVIADADHDGRAEVYITTAFVDAAPGLAALDGLTGRTLWKAASLSQAYQSTVVADIDGDGTDEILFGDKNTRLYCHDARGRRRWVTQLGGRGIFYAPVVARLQGHGAVVVVGVRTAGADGHALYALAPDGHILDQRALPGGGTSPLAICRFRGSVSLSVLALSNSGILGRHDIGAGSILWPRPAAHPTKLGVAAAPPAAADGPIIRSAAVCGDNVLPVRWGSAARWVTARTVAPDGSVHVAVARPWQKSITVRTSIAGAYAVDLAGLSGVPGRPSWRERRTLVLSPGFDADIAQHRAFLAAVGRMKSAHSSLARWCVAQADAELALARSDRSPGAFERLRATRRYYLALLAAHDLAPNPGSRMLTQALDPWRTFDAAEVLRTGRRGSLRLAVLGNETESAAFALTNLETHAVTLRLHCTDFRSRGGHVVEAGQVARLHEVLQVTPVTTGRSCDDPLPELGPTGTLRLGPGETRPVWLSVCSRDLQPGVYRADLQVGDVAAPGPPSVFGLEIEVAKVALPPSLRFRHCNWLSLGAARNERVLEATVSDALAHGTSVFVVPAPTVRLDAAGRAVSVEGALHDWALRRLVGRAFLLVSGAPAPVWPDGAAPSAQQTEAAFAGAIRAYAAHMLRQGWLPRDYALYLMDEPGLCGPDPSFEHFVDLVKRVKAAEPTMGIYANPAGGARAEILKPLAGLVDVWCPDLHLYRGDPVGLGPIFRSGREWWSYEAPGDQRTLSPLGFYRMQPWVAFQIGSTGSGYWVHSYDPYWFVEPGKESEYGAVYMTESGPVTTKRWEATRDGIEDYELLCLVRDVAARVGGRAGADALAALREAVTFVTAGQERVTDIGRQVEPYTPDYCRWMYHRARLVGVLERLGASPMR